MNLFSFETPPLDAESFDELLKRKNVTIKRIVSNTLTTPREFLQEEAEFVVVLQGCAKIEMEGIVHKLKKGDTLFIPPNTPHTLLKTEKTVVWLAVYIKEEDEKCG